MRKRPCQLWQRFTIPFPARNLIVFLTRKRERPGALPPFNMTRKTSRVLGRALKGAVAGLAGGLAGSAAMNEFQQWWNIAARRRHSRQRSQPQEDPATVKAARAFSEKALGHPLPEQRKGAAGSLVHYLFGTLNGGLYGAVAEVSPAARAASGVLFGAALFVAADEVLVPLFGWSGPPKKYPWTTHAYGLASHVLYGLTAEQVRRAVLRAM